MVTFRPCLTALAAVVALAGCDDEPAKPPASQPVVKTETAAKPPAASDWSQFLEKMKAGVKARDRAALRGLMHPDFAARNYDPGPAAWEKHFATSSDQPWQELELALRTEPREIAPSPQGRQQMETSIKSACADCRYGVSLVFERGADGQWRWIALDYPGD